jgi:hypothetical protein
MSIACAGHLHHPRYSGSCSPIPSLGGAHCTSVAECNNLPEVVLATGQCRYPDDVKDQRPAGTLVRKQVSPARSDGE